MPRRKKPSYSPLLILLGTLSTLWLAAFLLRYIETVELVLFACVIIGGVLAVYIKIVLPAHRRQHIVEVQDQWVSVHMDQLVREYVRRARSDPYGRPLLEKWNEHLLREFLPHHIRARLSAPEQILFDKDWQNLLNRVTSQVQAARMERPAFPTISAVTTASEFELFCAEQLILIGWEAHRTQQSRDQGVDVLAEKNGCKVVLQCKLYTNPVGVHAVQEIVAGRGHHQADVGAVVTNSRFTSDAEMLARTNGILLLHHSDLPQLDQLLSKTTIAIQQNLGWN